MLEFTKKIFPLNRSLTGKDVVKTLSIIKKKIPNLIINNVKSRTKIFDWTVPDEWNVKDAYIINPNGEKFAEFKINNIHLMGYSIPLNKTLALDELKKKIYFLKKVGNSAEFPILSCFSGKSLLCNLSFSVQFFLSIFYFLTLIVLG